MTAYNIAKELNLISSFDEVTTGIELESYFEQGTSVDEMESIIKQLLTKYKEGDLKIDT